METPICENICSFISLSLQPFVRDITIFVVGGEGGPGSLSNLPGETQLEDEQRWDLISNSSHSRRAGGQTRMSLKWWLHPKVLYRHFVPWLSINEPHLHPLAPDSSLGGTLRTQRRRRSPGRAHRQLDCKPQGQSTNAPLPLLFWREGQPCPFLLPSRLLPRLSSAQKGPLRSSDSKATSGPSPSPPLAPLPLTRICCSLRPHRRPPVSQVTPSW